MDNEPKPDIDYETAMKEAGVGVYEVMKVFEAFRNEEEEHVKHNVSIHLSGEIVTSNHTDISLRSPDIGLSSIIKE